MSSSAVVQPTSTLLLPAHHNNKPNPTTTRWIDLRKDDPNDRLGFNIKGGHDFGRPVYIHIVEKGSLADRQGLKSGHLILSANHIPFNQIKHHDALKVLKSSGSNLLLEVLSPADQGLSTGPMTSAGVGGQGQGVGGPTSMMLGSFRGEYYTWVDRFGNEVPPPINNPSSMNQQNKRVLNIEINPGQNLGLMIRGGYEYGLGIYVTGVDPGSVAERAGLQRGDEVLEVNGRSFTTITHDKAVAILKSCRKMTIVASYIGKIPADNQILEASHHGDKLLDDSGSNTDELIDLDTNLNLVTTATDHNHHNTGDFLLMKNNQNSFDQDELDDIIQDGNNHQDFKDNMVLDFNEGSDFNQIDLEKTTGMIEEKARTVLTKSEHSRFTFYRLEYQQGFLPVQTFVRILTELLSTTEKYTLLTEVRELIRPSDVQQFDELIYNKHYLTHTKKNVIRHYPDQDTQQLADQPLMLPPPPGPIPSGPGPSVTSSSAPLALPPIPGQGQGQVPPNTLPVVTNSYGKVSPNLRHSPHNQQGQYTEYEGQGPQGQRSQLLISHDPVIAKMQQQQQMLSQQQQLVNPNNSSSSGNSSSSQQPTSCVRYKVRVQKTKPILGIAIEGGANTPHRLPRVISVNTEGSAYGSNLKAGQVLLTVDGKKLDGLTHEDIARSILDSYVDMSKLFIEFVVVEAKSSFISGTAVGGGGASLNQMQPTATNAMVNNMGQLPMMASSSSHAAISSGG